MKALVTGGGGFLGSHLVRALLARGDDVRVLGRGSYPDIEALGVEVVKGDIRDADTVAASARGVEVVFHTAAKAGGWGKRSEFESINVAGTENVLAACLRAGVARLIYTSSPSVVHAKRDIEGEDEALPYATRWNAHYPRTKALAEQRVRAAGGSLRTIALRPHFIWGPGDTQLLPRLVLRARAGRLRQVGFGDPLTDTTYVDNCVDAHLAADRALAARAELAGRVYFVSDGAPVGVWTMAKSLLDAVDGGSIGRPIPAWLAYAVGAALEGAHAALSLSSEPIMTRFAASELSHAQWFDISAARRDLGYEPRVTMAEGLRRLAQRRNP